MVLLTNSDLFISCSAAGGRQLGLGATMGTSTYSAVWDCMIAWIRSQFDDHGQVNSCRARVASLH